MASYNREEYLKKIAKDFYEENKRIKSLPSITNKPDEKTSGSAVSKPLKTTVDMVKEKIAATSATKPQPPKVEQPKKQEVKPVAKKEEPKSKKEEGAFLRIMYEKGLDTYIGEDGKEYKIYNKRRKDGTRDGFIKTPDGAIKKIKSTSDREYPSMEAAKSAVSPRKIAAPKLPVSNVGILTEYDLKFDAVERNLQKKQKRLAEYDEANAHIRSAYENAKAKIENENQSKSMGIGYTGPGTMDYEGVKEAEKTIMRYSGAYNNYKRQRAALEAQMMPHMREFAKMLAPKTKQLREEIEAESKKSIIRQSQAGAPIKRYETAAKELALSYMEDLIKKSRLQTESEAEGNTFAQTMWNAAKGMAPKEWFDPNGGVRVSSIPEGVFKSAASAVGLVETAETARLMRRMTTNPESLSKDEQLAVFSKFAKDEAEQLKTTGSASQVGEGVLASIPFLTDFMLTAGYGSAAEAGAKQGAKSLITRLAVNNGKFATWLESKGGLSLVNKLASAELASGATPVLAQTLKGTPTLGLKAAEKITSSFVGAAAIAPLQPSFYKTVIKDYSVGRLTKNKYGEYEQKDLKDLKTSITNGFMEVYSEKIGEHILSPLVKRAQSVLMPELADQTATAASEFMTSAMTRMRRATSTAATKANVEDLFTEYAEEKINETWTALSGQSSWKDFFDADKNKITFLTTAMMSGMFKVPSKMIAGGKEVLLAIERNDINKKFREARFTSRDGEKSMDKEIKGLLQKAFAGKTIGEVTAGLAEIQPVYDQLNDSDKKTFADLVTARLQFAAMSSMTPGVQKAFMESIGKEFYDRMDREEIAVMGNQHDSGKFVKATLNIGGKTATTFVKSGSIKTKEDGTIDYENSDPIVTLFDKNGLAQVSTAAISGIEEVEEEEVYRVAAENRAREVITPTAQKTQAAFRQTVREELTGEIYERELETINEQLLNATGKEKKQLEAKKAAIEKEYEDSKSKEITIYFDEYTPEIAALSEYTGIAPTPSETGVKVSSMTVDGIPITIKGHESNKLATNSIKLTNGQLADFLNSGNASLADYRGRELNSEKVDQPQNTEEVVSPSTNIEDKQDQPIKESEAQQDNQDANKELNEIWADIYQQDRHGSSLDDGFVNTAPFNESVQYGSDNLASHGMSKTGMGNAINELIKIFENGIDPNRRGGLDAAPLTNSSNSQYGTTGGGVSYRDGVFILVGKNGHTGKFTNINQIAGILVNSGVVDINPKIIDALRNRFPELIIESYDNAPSLVRKINEEKQDEITLNQGGKKKKEYKQPKGQVRAEKTSSKREKSRLINTHKDTVSEKIARLTETQIAALLEKYGLSNLQELRAAYIKEKRTSKENRTGLSSEMDKLFEKVSITRIGGMALSFTEDNLIKDIFETSRPKNADGKPMTINELLISMTPLFAMARKWVELSNENPNADKEESVESFYQTFGLQLGIAEGDFVTQMEADNIKGRINLGSSHNLVQLFQSADVSTLIHEFIGHFGVVVSNDIATKYPDSKFSKSFNVAMKEMGFEKNKKTGWMLFGEKAEAAHEKMATECEKYFTTNRSSSPALANFFSTIRGWMKKIYSALKEEDLKVNDKVAEYFDQMFDGLNLSSIPLINEMIYSESDVSDKDLKKIKDAIWDDVDKIISDSKDDMAVLTKALIKYVNKSTKKLSQAQMTALIKTISNISLEKSSIEDLKEELKTIISNNNYANKLLSIDKRRLKLKAQLRSVEGKKKLIGLMPYVRRVLLADTRLFKKINSMGLMTYYEGMLQNLENGKYPATSEEVESFLELMDEYERLFDVSKSKYVPEKPKAPSKEAAEEEVKAYEKELANYKTIAAQYKAYKQQISNILSSEFDAKKISERIEEAKGVRLELEQLETKSVDVDEDTIASVEKKIKDILAMPIAGIFDFKSKKRKLQGLKKTIDRIFINNPIYLDTDEDGRPTEEYDRLHAIHEQISAQEDAMIPEGAEFEALKATMKAQIEVNVNSSNEDEKPMFRKLRNRAYIAITNPRFKGFQDINTIYKLLVGMENLNEGQITGTIEKALAELEDYYQIEMTRDRRNRALLSSRNNKISKHLKTYETLVDELERNPVSLWGRRLGWFKDEFVYAIIRSQYQKAYVEYENMKATDINRFQEAVPTNDRIAALTYMFAYEEAKLFGGEVLNFPIKIDGKNTVAKMTYLEFLKSSEIPYSEKAKFFNLFEYLNTQTDAYINANGKDKFIKDLIKMHEKYIGLNLESNQKLIADKYEEINDRIKKEIEDGKLSAEEISALKNELITEAEALISESQKNKKDSFTKHSSSDNAKAISKFLEYISSYGDIMDDKTIYNAAIQGTAFKKLKMYVPQISVMGKKEAQRNTSETQDANLIMSTSGKAGIKEDGAAFERNGNLNIIYVDPKIVYKTRINITNNRTFAPAYNKYMKLLSMIKAEISADPQMKPDEMKINAIIKAEETLFLKEFTPYNSSYIEKFASITNNYLTFGFLLNLKKPIADLASNFIRMWEFVSYPDAISSAMNEAKRKEEWHKFIQDENSVIRDVTNPWIGSTDDVVTGKINKKAALWIRWADNAISPLLFVSRFQAKFKERTGKDFDLLLYNEISDEGKAYRAKHYETVLECIAEADASAEMSFGARNSMTARSKDKLFPWSKPVDTRNGLMKLVKYMTNLAATDGRAYKSGLEMMFNGEAAKGSKIIAARAASNFAYVYLMGILTTAINAFTTAVVKSYGDDDEFKKLVDDKGGIVPFMLSEMWDQATDLEKPLVITIGSSLTGSYSFPTKIGLIGLDALTRSYMKYYKTDKVTDKMEYQTILNKIQKYENIGFYTGDLNANPKGAVGIARKYLPAQFVLPAQAIDATLTAPEAWALAQDMAKYGINDPQLAGTNNMKFKQMVYDDKLSKFKEKASEVEVLAFQAAYALKPIALIPVIEKYYHQNMKKYIKDSKERPMYKTVEQSKQDELREEGLQDAMVKELRDKGY